MKESPYLPFEKRVSCKKHYINPIPFPSVWNLTKFSQFSSLFDSYWATPHLRSIMQLCVMQKTPAVSHLPVEIQRKMHMEVTETRLLQKRPTNESPIWMILNICYFSCFVYYVTLQHVSWNTAFMLKTSPNYSADPNRITPLGKKCGFGLNPQST